MSGIAQVIVQPCALSGTIILGSIALHSWQMALGAFFGAVIGTISAVCFNFKSDDITLGLYGYNATLIGIANIYFFQTTPVSIIVLIFCCICSVYVTKWIPQYLKLPAFTTPFVLITWIAILARDIINLAPAKNVFNFVDNLHTAGLGEAVGQVYIQGNGITGIIMLVAILLCSKSSFVWAIVAITSTWLLAHALNYSAINIQNARGDRQFFDQFVFFDLGQVGDALDDVLVHRVVVVHVELHHRDDAAELRNEPAQHLRFVHQTQGALGMG